MPNKKGSIDTEDDFYSKPKSTQKRKATAPKEDTKEVSLALFKEGKSVAEIAATRKVTTSTIEGHLAHFVAQGLVQAKDLVPEHRLEKIIDAITELKTIRLNDIREHLGKSYAFGEIKIAIAAHLAEGN